MGRTDYVLLNRLVPVENGILFLYGDRGVLFGDGDRAQMIRAYHLNHLEQALNPFPFIQSFAIFEKAGINYSSSAQICRDGNRGWMFSIIGPGFYNVMSTSLGEVLDDAECDSLEGYVVAGHTRLMARQLRSVGRVEVTGQGVMNGHAMNWVIVSRK